MLATLDIKIIGVVGVLLLIVVGYFVYSLYKDLVFLKSQVNSPKESGEVFFKGEEPIGDIEYDDEVEDEELERHLENIMRQTHIMAQEENHNHRHIQELEPIVEMEELQEDEIQVKQEVEEPVQKKRKYKKKVTIVEPIDEQVNPEIVFAED
jgi:hypothetical protein